MNGHRRDELDELFIKQLQTRNIPAAPESCQNRVKNVLDNLDINKPGKRQKTKLLYGHGKLVAVFLLAVLLGSVTVGAKIPVFYRRLQSVSKSEKKKMVHGVQSAKVNADDYSRRLSDEEQKRYVALEKKYEQGTYPAGALTEVSDPKEVGDYTDRIWYCDAEGMFYIPQKRLTDEQLLQIIDFRRKREYAVAEQSEAETAATATPTVKLSKEVCEEKAEKVLSELFGLDTTKMTCKVKKGKDAVKTEGKNTRVFNEITCRSDDWKYSYCVRVDDKTGRLADAEINEKEDIVSATKSKINIKEYYDFGKEFRKRIMKYFELKKDDINNIEVVFYTMQSKKYNEEDSVICQAELANEQFIRAEYSDKIHSIYKVYYLSKETYREGLKMRNKYINQRGLKENTIIIR